MAIDLEFEGLPLLLSDRIRRFFPDHSLEISGKIGWYSAGIALVYEEFVLIIHPKLICIAKRGG
jgi:hypothetical protein